MVEESDLFLCREFAQPGAGVLRTAHHEGGETFLDEGLCIRLVAIFHDDLDPAGHAGLGCAGGIGLRNDGLRQYGDLLPLARSEKGQLVRVKRLAHFREDTLRQRDAAAKGHRHNFQKFPAFHRFYMSVGKHGSDGSPLR